MSGTDPDREFWARQTSSLHRREDEGFFRAKAQEHAALMSPEDLTGGCVDLGCGAGELLLHFSRLVPVTTAIDYSDSMLKAARRRMGASHVELINRAIFSYLPDSRYRVWTSCQAINQYLDPAGINRFLDMFAANPSARTLYLFDCIDPLRYRLKDFGIGYGGGAGTTSTMGTQRGWRQARRTVRRVAAAVHLATGFYARPAQKLSSAGMGYGYLPMFWLQSGRSRNLEVELASSRFYEYRYHTIIRKEVVDAEARSRAVP